MQSNLIVRTNLPLKKAASCRLFRLSRTRQTILHWILSFNCQELSREQLKPALAKFESHLISLNVAREIAEQVCESVATTLEGKSHSNFSSMASLFPKYAYPYCKAFMQPLRAQW